jgi:ArsR family transcriptional regulator
MAVLSRTDANALAVVAKALSSPARLQLVSLLLDGPSHPYELQDDLRRAGNHLSQSTVSHHLGKLVDAGLASNEKDGRLSMYELSDAGQIAVARFLGKADR